MIHAVCYAKINLTLEILARRPDGFHEIASLAHSVKLGDELRVEPADTLSCEVEGRGEDPHLPADDENNLVVRAARLLAAETGVATGAHFHLRKWIPAAAGLGGGSSDAAAALLLLNELWGTHLSIPRLAKLALQLGSDVPFFLRGGAAIMRGRGEALEWLPRIEMPLVLLSPLHEIGNKTAALYRAIQPTDFSDGKVTVSAAGALRSGFALRDADLVNAFERPARAVFPGLARLWSAAEDVAERPFHLSGAGPTLFALVRDRADAHNLEDRLKALDVRTYVVRTARTAHTRVSAAPSTQGATPTLSSGDGVP
jgi:4-diphosphocytidyl-2-C-methyl-D-erythritol kinase